MEQHSPDRSGSDEGLKHLPCPEPSSSAIEAGIFGFDDNEAIVPSMDDARTLTEEHARELLCILNDVGHLQTCERHGVDPVSGRAPRGEDRRHALRQRLARETAALLAHYDDALAAYADAFGWEAAEALDQFVRATCADDPQQPAPLRQQELF